MNYLILNYLNMINERLGTKYQKTGRSPLPKNFVVTDDVIKEQLNLVKIEYEKSYPNFLFEERDFVKKKFKTSLNNLTKLTSTTLPTQLSQEFADKLKIYINTRKLVTQSILKDFNSSNFVETDAFDELVDINPIMAEIFEKIFDDDFDVDKLFDDIEQKYSNLLSAKAKSKLQEKKQSKTKQVEQHRIDNALLQEMAEREIKEQLSKQKELKKERKTEIVAVNEDNSLEKTKKLK